MASRNNRLGREDWFLKGASSNPYPICYASAICYCLTGLKELQTTIDTSKTHLHDFQMSFEKKEPFCIDDFLECFSHDFGDGSSKSVLVDKTRDLTIDGIKVNGFYPLIIRNKNNREFALKERINAILNNIDNVWTALPNSLVEWNLEAQNRLHCLIHQPPQE